MATESPSASLSTETLSAGRPLARASEDDEIDSTFDVGDLATASTGPSLVGIERALTCLTELVESPTWTASSRVLSYAVPAGTTVSWDWTVWVTAAAVRSRSVRSSGRRVMVSWVVSSPVTCTWRTPSIAVRAGTATFCTSSTRLRERQIGGGGQQQHRDVVGAAGDDVGLDIGGQGACEAESTALRMLLTTLSLSRPYSQLTLIVAWPLDEVEVTSVTPETPLTARSIGVETLSATICGVAPG